MLDLNTGQICTDIIHHVCRQEIHTPDMLVC